MSNMNRRDLMKGLIGAGASAVILPNITYANNLDPDEINIANWVKQTGEKEVEDKYKIDETGNNKFLGNVSFYIREIAVGNDKWCVNYSDFGKNPSNPELITSDGIPNEYDSLSFGLCTKPFDNRKTEDNLELLVVGLNGELQAGNLRGNSFLNPKDEMFKYNPDSAADPVRLKDRMNRIEKNLGVYREAMEFYKNLKRIIVRDYVDKNG